MLKALKSLFEEADAAHRVRGQERWHLHVACADGPLDAHEDHCVRKIGHLLYVTNTDILLARSRARPGR
jgi:uncharacterized tellurite resistance protein B-like protein